MRRFLQDDSGQDAIEYSLLLGFIALAGAATYFSISTNINTLWNLINGRLKNASN